MHSNKRCFKIEYDLKISTFCSFTIRNALQFQLDFMASVQRVLQANKLEKVPIHTCWISDGIVFYSIHHWIGMKCVYFKCDMHIFISINQIGSWLPNMILTIIDTDLRLLLNMLNPVRDVFHKYVYPARHSHKCHEHGEFSVQ